MRKSIFTLAPVVVALLAGMGVAQAAPNAQINITASVVNSTCDVSLNQSNLDLGNFTKSDFSAVNAPVTKSVKNFMVSLSNCAGTPVKADTASLTVTGSTLGSATNIFNTNTNSNTGVMLSTVAEPTKYITAGQKLTVATAGDTPTAGEFNGKSLSLQAGLATTTLTAPTIGLVSAPVTFSFIYN